MKLRLYINSVKHGQMYKDFDSQESLDSYLVEVTESQHWGHLEYTEIIPAVEEVRDEEDNIIVEAQEEQKVVHPATVSFVVEDVTEQLQLQKDSNEALAYLNDTDWMVLRHIRQKALQVETSLTEQEYLTLEQDRAEASIRVIHE